MTNCTGCGEVLDCAENGRACKEGLTNVARCDILLEGGKVIELTVAEGYCVLKDGQRRVAFTKDESNLPALVRRAYEWGYRDGYQDFIDNPDPQILYELTKPVK